MSHSWIHPEALLSSRRRLLGAFSIGWLYYLTSTPFHPNLIFRTNENGFCGRHSGNVVRAELCAGPADWKAGFQAEKHTHSKVVCFASTPAVTSRDCRSVMSDCPLPHDLIQPLQSRLTQALRITIFLIHLSNTRDSSHTSPSECWGASELGSCRTERDSLPSWVTHSISSAGTEWPPDDKCTLSAGGTVLIVQPLRLGKQCLTIVKQLIFASGLPLPLARKHLQTNLFLPSLSECRPWWFFFFFGHIREQKQDNKDNNKSALRYLCPDRMGLSLLSCPDRSWNTSAMPRGSMLWGIKFLEMTA